MKKHNQKLLVLTLLLSSLLSASDLHAQVFMNLGETKESAWKILGDAKKALTEANKKRIEADKARAIEKEKRKAQAALEASTDDSLIELKGDAGTGVKWVLIQVSKNSFQEVSTFSAENGKYAMTVTLKDGPGLYDVKIFKSEQERYGTSYTFSRATTIENTDERDMSFLLPSERVQVNAPEIRSLVEAVTKDARNEEEAIRQIHDFITKTIKYDTASYEDESYKIKSYDAVDVLKRKVGVCAGYSNLLAAMARAYGIRTKVIHGLAKVPKGMENHAWNEVFINNEWKIIDSTWNASLKSDKYYFIDEELFSQDHQKEKELND